MRFKPVMICDHGDGRTMSFHADQAEQHIRIWHTSYAEGDGSFPMNARVATRDEHIAAGWDVSEYPHFIKG